MTKDSKTVSDLPYSQSELFSMGKRRVYEGVSLREIAFPLGGIGTGTVSLGGRGELRDWEIFNRPAKGASLPYTFFAIWAKQQDGKPIAKVLESRLLPPYRGSHGIPTGQAPGLPRMSGARFIGEYPFARIEFTDDDLPLEVSLEAFNPFIPLDSKDSGLPVAIFHFTLKNMTGKYVETTVAANLLNPIGYDPGSPLVKEFEVQNRRFQFFGLNLNEFVQETSFAGILMTSHKYPAEDPKSGSLFLSSTWKDITYSLRWPREGWWGDLQGFWDDFSTDGLLDNNPTAELSPDGETDVGSLGLRARLAPGETVTLPFIIAWYFPNLTNYWNQEPAARGKRLGTYYSTIFEDAVDVTRYTVSNLKRLEGETRRFHDALFSSTLPDPVIDAVSSQCSIIRTPTCIWTQDGSFHAFEGCHDRAGCCPMNCTHVWNYEQALAHLFPDLERTMRHTDFKVNTLDSGHMAFRTILPAGCCTWNFKPAADGQMGCIMKLYREWKLSGDIEFLKSLWPDAKKALEFAWTSWDQDKDGVIEGEQHNTYDIEFYGPNSMMGSLYLGALRAAEEMAQALGDTEAALEYRKVFEKGSKRLDEQLWNGEYYIQRYDPEQVKRYQYGEGCLSDQLLGQWFAEVVGLGYLLPRDKVRQALKSIFNYNWKRDLRNFANCQRVYALDNEKGLVVCSWPKGGRPEIPLPYCDEVWTGIEYQVAAHLIYEGFVEEGLAIVKGVRDRYDGEKRNPWDEVECGHHYARAMASWSLLLALSGYEYSAPEMQIGFAPRISPEHFQCLFTTGSAWGIFSQELKDCHFMMKIEALYGELKLRRIHVSIPRALQEDVTTVQVSRAAEDEDRASSISIQKDSDRFGNTRVAIDLGKPVLIKCGERIEVNLVGALK